MLMSPIILKLIVIFDTNAKIVHFDTGAEGDYTRFARAKNVT